MKHFPVNTKILLTILALIPLFCATGQNVRHELTFTAIDSVDYTRLDSIKVMNRTQGGAMVIFWPDTTVSVETTPGDELLAIGYLTRYPVGTGENNPVEERFTLFQSVPNPVKEQSFISMFIPEKGLVNVLITDARGRCLIRSSWELEKGDHLFRYTPGDCDLVFLRANWNSINRSIKILSTGNPIGKKPAMEYVGADITAHPLKASPLKQGFVKESGIVVSPESNETYTFQFATKISCPGLPAITYEGQEYHTIQILSQCWLQENLNVGSILLGNNDMTNNGVIEKYCYGDNPANCGIYGGLYMWNEMMQYTVQNGARGICPQGWHIPDDEEWKVLEGAVDSLYGIGDLRWDDKGLNGFNTGLNLKSLSGWSFSGNGIDLFGFWGLPGGDRFEMGGFGNVGYMGYWWSSTENGSDMAWNRNLNYTSTVAGRYDTFKKGSCSVRCIRNY